MHIYIYIAMKDPNPWCMLCDRQSPKASRFISKFSSSRSALGGAAEHNGHGALAKPH